MTKPEILIVDDEPDLAAAYGRMLTRAGYEVSYADSGASCLERIRERNPDLVLLDVVLPDADGIEVCRRIKADPELASVFVINISGLRTSPEQLAEGLEAGADGYLAKPLNERTLVAHVRALLRIRSTEQALRASEERHRLLVTELQEANRRLQEYNRLKAEFVANISHELRTPLTAIIGFANLAQIAQRTQTLPPFAADAFERILRNGRHLLALIDDVLDLSKIEAGRMPIHCEHFEVPDVVQAAFAELQALAEQRGLSYKLRVEGDLPLAYTDPLRLRQVAINLLSNAIKFTSRGSVEVVLRAIEPDRFELVVTDTGIGIDEHAQGLIFDRFRQVDGSTTRVAGGVGLGLAIVRQIVELLGGEVSLASTSGVGSAFTVRLPFVAPERAATVEFESGASLGRDEVGASEEDADKSGAPLVLIVEDDPDSAALLSSTIASAGYRVRCAADGVTGLRLARELEPAAVLLDVMMPGMDGWRVMRELKSEPRTAQIPVIVCSIVDNRPLGYRLGASDYLIKPVDPHQLLSTLQNVSTSEVHASEGYVLVVDDEHGIRELLSAALRHAGFEVRAAASGESALKIAAQSTPRAVLSDLMMPGGMSGFELIARMRSNPAMAHVPIIVITGKDLAAEDRRLIAGEIADVIRKGDLLMSDLELRLRETLKELGVNPNYGENPAD